MTVDHIAEKARIQRLSDHDLNKHLSDCEFRCALATEEIRRRAALRDLPSAFTEYGQRLRDAGFENPVASPTINEQGSGGTSRPTDNNQGLERNEDCTMQVSENA